LLKNAIFTFSELLIVVLLFWFLKVLITQRTQWNSAFFAFSLIIEGTTEKVLQFIMPLKSFYNRNFVSIEQNMNFEHYGEFQARKT
jgi:hypothetical protein